MRSYFTDLYMKLSRTACQSDWVQAHQQQSETVTSPLSYGQVGVNFRLAQPIPRSWNRENLVTGVGVLDIGAGLSDKQAGRKFRQKKTKNILVGPREGQNPLILTKKSRKLSPLGKTHIGPGCGGLWSGHPGAALSE